ncbi:hypothetical protein AB0O01_24980 [Streptomyces sp. NPDC093252]|uniref:hypothetical protein n=1 Tax=Streptomyces sp. NPDC093252 TaxID=3154980 RepID=UPI003427D71B
MTSGTDPTRDAWESAAVRLLDDVYTFVATGPRTPADWRSDALTVLNRRTEDPRGWRTLDWDTHEEGRTSFPFRPLSPDTLADHLRETTREHATRLLEIMAAEWESYPPRTPETATRRAADAHLLLARYGDEATYHTNVTKLGDRVSGWWPFTDYTGDFGFIVVSPEEVGVFWAFDAR